MRTTLINLPLPTSADRNDPLVLLPAGPSLALAQLVLPGDALRDPVCEGRVLVIRYSEVPRAQQP